MCKMCGLNDLLLFESQCSETGSKEGERGVTCHRGPPARIQAVDIAVTYTLTIGPPVCTLTNFFFLSLYVPGDCSSLFMTVATSPHCSRTGQKRTSG